MNKEEGVKDLGRIRSIEEVRHYQCRPVGVYNSHNGCYGHGIVVAVDQKPILEDSL